MPNTKNKVAMDLEDATAADAIARLRRIEGQVGGIIRMIESGRGCREVVQQVSASSKALDQVGLKLLVSGLRFCALDEKGARAAGYTEEELEKLFLRLA